MPGSFDDTSLPYAIAVTKATSIADVSRFNASLKAGYLTQFNAWTVCVLAGKINNQDPPKPPLGFRLSAPDRNGFQWYELGTEAVCSMPPIPADHSKTQEQIDAEIGPNHISIGHSLGGDYFEALPDDTWPFQRKTPPLPARGADWADNTVFMKVGFMGKGWYLKT